MGKTEEDNVLGYIEEYYQNYQEIKKIQSDILQYRKKFDSSLKKLKKEMSKMEEHIIKYINDNNHPGIKYKDKIFTPESGKVRISSKKREQNIEKILNKYQINQSHPLYVELNDVFQSKKDNNNIQLKIKKYQE
jgi:septal ring factor EnvC (AmiA/AmiB activator)